MTYQDVFSNAKKPGKINYVFYYTDWYNLSYTYSMAGKAALTTQYILETVAPVFNKYGYAATTMSEITKATRLTKGAIYGNFESKEDLALQAFNHTIRQVLGAVSAHMQEATTPREKLLAMTDFYRHYYPLTKKYGGCPLLNVGVDSKHQNPLLLKRVRDIVKKLQTNVATIIRDGIQAREFRKSVNAETVAIRLIALIEGGVYMATLMDDEQHLVQMMDHIDAYIRAELMTS